MNPNSKLIAIAIDKDRSSQTALRWTVENLLVRGQTLLLVHVRTKPNGSSSPYSSSSSLALSRSNQSFDMDDSGSADDAVTKELFLPFRVFCTRKDIQCQDIVLDEADVVKALLEYVGRTGIEVLVLGAPQKGGFFRSMKARDIPASVLKGVPDFCTVYIISKGKISSTKAAARPAPPNHPIRQQILQMHQAGARSSASSDAISLIPPHSRNASYSGTRPDIHMSSLPNDPSSLFKSPFSHRKGPNGRPYELPPTDTDISFVSSGRPSIDNMFLSFADSNNATTPPRLSGISDVDCPSVESMHFGRRSMDIPSEFSYVSLESDYQSSQDDVVDVEMRRLKMELKQTMEMYSTVCKEALSAKQKALELNRWKQEEQQRLAEAQRAEDAAEREKAKSRRAFEHAEAAHRIAELEAQKRINAEMKANKELEEKNKSSWPVQPAVRYRVYTIDEIEVATNYFDSNRKIGEGGYGPVYKCFLDHTPVAVKVLRPDAAHGRSQFQQEVEVLSCIRHPNMVLLLGACPEYGCIVYEYMLNGSLEDRLFRRGNTPPLPWPHRFRIAAEIATGLLFLHQTKPEPLVHRDLKPANILLDRNFVSKISDVGLARLVPASVADTVTQYRMTSTAGTFCYIDPEYQQTGMLGVKSDVYSLGIIFLQLLTGKAPMGLTHYVDRAIDKGTFVDMLDPAISDWPVDEALTFAKLALKCAELRRKDRPDLGKVVLPLLEKLRMLGEDKLSYSPFIAPPTQNRSQNDSQVSLPQEEMSYSSAGQDSFDSSKGNAFNSS